MKKFAVAVYATLVFMPFVTLAQGTVKNNFGQVGAIFQELAQFINDVLVPLVFALAFLLFIWGVFQYFIFGGGDEEKREKGKGLMLWGIIGFVLMVSIWGIVNIISSGLGIQQEGVQKLPNAPTQQN